MSAGNRRSLRTDKLDKAIGTCPGLRGTRSRFIRRFISCRHVVTGHLVNVEVCKHTKSVRLVRITVYLKADRFPVYSRQGTPCPLTSSPKRATTTLPFFAYGVARMARALEDRFAAHAISFSRGFSPAPRRSGCSLRRRIRRSRLGGGTRRGSACPAPLSSGRLAP